MTLIVDEQSRKKGIGKKIVLEAEKRAHDRGAKAVALNTGNREEREIAHQFYRKLGFIEKSIGFYKPLE